MHRSPRLAAAILLGLGLVVLAVWHAGQLATRNQLQAAAARAETALGLTKNALAAYLARHEVAPQLLAELEDIRRLVADPANSDRVAAINAMLEAKNDRLQSSDIYIMDMTGTTIAASNHRRRDSFVGQNFSYRPYFFDAANGFLTRFYALGTTSGVRGYYFSAPVRAPDGAIAGVIAVKVEIDSVEQSWRGNEYTIFVTDPEGIVFMASDPALRYAALLPLTPERLTRTTASRRYSDAQLHEITFRPQAGQGVMLAQLAVDGQLREQVVTAQHMPDIGWTVHVLIDSAGARAEARVVTVALALLLCVAGFGVLVLLQRRARVAERLALQARAKADLEQRVIERTADLARVNSHLEQEITERVATEAALRAAQANLVRVGKLAALGQMSAALSHEINQPLAAARNYADSAAILIDRGEPARARENMGHILALIDRMSAIGRHLRNAARKPKERLQPVDLATLLTETRIILAGRLASARADLVIDIAPGFPAVMAGTTRLQQVLVNLISNACDAVEGHQDRRILLTARLQDGRALIAVRDHGPGVAPGIAERIFDPFFTTKGPGAGLGLGLSITYNIVRDFGGEITLRAADPGAEFILSLAPAPAMDAAA